MNYSNRINRLTEILTLLSKGSGLSTPFLVEKFKVTKKIIQTDLKEYILPFFPNKKIYYDYSSKTYKAKNNFLAKILFTAEELAIISILKSKSKDKHTDEDLSIKTETLFNKFEEVLNNSVYQKSAVENIDSFREAIIEIKNAIETKNIIKCTYNKKDREIYPLKILNLEGYWYLIVYEPKDKKIKTFHLNTIKNIEQTEEIYSYDKDIIENFDNAVTAYYKPENKTINIQLLAENRVARFFIRKPLSKTQRVIKEYEDGSIELELTVTDLMEIIPTVQRYIPFVHIIEPKELMEEVERNIRSYIKDFE